MSLVTKNVFEYGDGGLGVAVFSHSWSIITKAQQKVDAIILESENLNQHSFLGEKSVSLIAQ